MKPASRRPAAALAGVVMLVGTGACTEDSEPAATPSSSSSPSETVTTRPASAPLKVVVTRVSGRLPAEDRPALEANVRRTLSAYVDAAFLAGDYPRTDFSGSFGAFTSGVARDARRDQGLLTNQPLGGTTVAVRATRRTAYLSVLAPHKVAAGVTANVHLVFVVDRGDQPAQRVSLKGRLLLTRNSARDWSIFGYDLARSSTPVRSGS